MHKPQLIRNISIIGEAGHGKTTLTDSLLAKAGLIPLEKVGKAFATDTRYDQKQRAVSIKSTPLSILLQFDDSESKEEGEESKSNSLPYLFNVIDTPGLTDFSAQASAALRPADGILVVVDSNQGFGVRVQTLLRQALSEKLKPSLFLNKMDRNILEFQDDSEAIYQKFLKVIEDINVVVSTQIQENQLPRFQIDPSQGNVAFGSGNFGWAFTLRQMAKRYNKKFGVKEDVMMKKLWGNSFLEHTKQGMKWKSSLEPQENIPRGFCSMALDPILSLTKVIMDGDEKKSAIYMSKLGIELKATEKDLSGKALFKVVFQQWMNAADAVIQMTILKIPSPKEAQKQRVESIYQGPMDDECAMSIRTCDPKGPLMMYISKMIPTDDKGKFLSFGSVFGGTVASGMNVRIMGPKYKLGSKDDLFSKTVTKTIALVPGKVQPVENVPCGNIVAISGLQGQIIKTATISTSQNAHLIKKMQLSISPVVRVYVEPKVDQQLPELIQGLKNLMKSDPIVQFINEQGKMIVCTAGELHLQNCLKDLKEEYAKVDFMSSDPFVSYKETIIQKSSNTCLAKSSNKHNRLFLEANPLDQELSNEIDHHQIGPNDEFKSRARKLVEKYEWEMNDARKIWSFGPEGTGSNLIIDMTKGVQYMNEIKDSVVAGFQWATQEGVLCCEPMRGIRFNIMDVTLHPDSIHRGARQIIPTMKRAMYASVLTAKPRIQEPLYLVQISSPSDVTGGIYSSLTQRRGKIYSQKSVPGSNIMTTLAYLPVNESFGFQASLRSSTQGKAVAQCSFDHWQVLQDDPLEPGTKSFGIVSKMRKIKNLKDNVEPLTEFLDKL